MTKESSSHTKSTGKLTADDRADLIAYTIGALCALGIVIYGNIIDYSVNAVWAPLLATVGVLSIARPPRNNSSRTANIIVGLFAIALAIFDIVTFVINTSN